MSCRLFSAAWLLLVLACSPQLWAQISTNSATGWRIKALPEMTIARAVHQAVRLPNGQVLTVGGCAGTGCAPVLAAIELLAPDGRSSSKLPSMHVPRVSHGLAALADGRVLIVGGWTGQADTASAELFEPATQRFVAAPAMSVARQHPIVIALQDGRVLVAGGGPQGSKALASAEVFQPATKLFSAVGNMQQARTHHAAAALPDGRVLVTGGLLERGVALATAELFDPRTGRFTLVGNMSGPRYKHAAVALLDGRVMVVGGSSGRDDKNRLASTEIFDPASGQFVAGPRLQAARFKINGAVVGLPNGTVVVAGGAEGIEVWSPGDAAFARVPGSLGAAWEFATAVPLLSGDVLVIGGYDEQIRSTAGVWLLTKN